MGTPAHPRRHPAKVPPGPAVEPPRGGHPLLRRPPAGPFVTAAFTRERTVPFRPAATIRARVPGQPGHSGARLSRKARIPSCASGVWLAAAMISTAYV